ncbi:hypothetical protein KR009_004311 [Drosophila setifemur]|nr:hypothetical protein KR009_004311 [Drosophila setifemur]
MDLSAKKTAVPIQNEPIQFKKKWEIPEKKPKNLESMLDPTRIIDLTDGEDPVKQPENITPKYPLLHSDPMFSVTNIFDKKVKLPDHNLPNISNEPVKKPAQESLLRNNNPGGSQAKAGTTGNLGKPGSGPIDLSTKKTADPIQNQNCQFTKDSAGFNAPPKRQGHNNAPTSSQVKAEAMLNGIYGWSVDEIAKAINEIPENLEEPPADAAVFNEIMGMVLTPIPVSQKLRCAALEQIVKLL